jgi:hypothetical protein
MTITRSRPIISKQIQSFLRNPADAGHGLAVEVCWNQPIRDKRSPTRKIAMEMLNLCSLMELVLEKEAATTSGGAVHERLDKLAHKLDGLLEKAESLVGQVEIYLSAFPAWQALFPRVWHHVGLSALPATSSASHFSHAQHLNTILSTSMALRHSLLDPRISHRYLAHQLALTYQSLSAAPELQKRFHQDIQSRFDNIKQQCSSGQTEAAMVRVDDTQGAWMYNLATELATQVGLQQNQGISGLFSQGGPDAIHWVGIVQQLPS